MNDSNGNGNLDMQHLPSTNDRAVADDIKRRYKCDESKPYLFISYSHRDSHKVLEILKNLISSGYNVWWDEGIDPGTEWDANIAAHVKGCSYFIAFVSNNYIASKNCKDELNYSRDLDKEQLLIYLEEVDLPDGMAMRMNRIQAVFWYNYGMSDMDLAYEKLSSAHGINVTKVLEKRTDISLNNYAAGSNVSSAVSNNGKGVAQSSGKSGSKLPVPAIAGIAVAALVVIVIAVSALSKGSGDNRDNVSAAADQTAEKKQEALAEEEEDHASMEPAGEMDKASEEVQKDTSDTRVVLIPDNAKSADDFIELGNAAYEKGDYENALEYYWTAYDMSRSDDTADAIVRTEKLIYGTEATPEQIKEWIDQGNKYMEEEKYDEAYDCYVRAASAGDNVGTGWTGEFWRFNYLGHEDHTIALAWYKTSPTNPFAMYICGLLYEERNDIENAVEYYNRSAQLGNEKAAEALERLN